MLATAALLGSACQSTNQRGNAAAVDDLLIEEAPTQDTDSSPAGGAASDASGSPSTPGATTSDGGSAAPTAAEGSTNGSTPGSSSARPGAPSSDGGSPGSTPTDDGSTPGRPPGQSDPGSLEMGTGVTEETITIGFQAGETGAAFAAVGAALQPAYEDEMAEALVDWVNATGGIRGRRLQAVIHETETTQGSFAAQAQRACSDFTEDNEVFAVVSSAVGGDDSMVACLHEKQTPLIERNTWVWDQTYFDEYPDLYRPGHLRAEDGYRAYLEGLQQIGFFDGATVGLLRFDAPVFDRIMDGVVNPTMGRLGVDFNEYVISSPGGVGDFGGSGAEMGAAVLRMRGDGVTHVIMVENAGIMPFFFLKEAESQGYRPTYGFSTIDIPDTQASQGDANQLSGAVAIGWAPGIDAGDGDMPDYETPNYLLCRQILSDAGVQNIAAFYAQSQCDAVFMLRAALERAPALTREGFRAGVAALGESYASPYTIGSSYAAGKRWGANTVRPLAYLDECECFRYFGQERRVA